MLIRFNGIRAVRLFCHHKHLLMCFGMVNMNCIANNDVQTKIPDWILFILIIYLQRFVSLVVLDLRII